MDWTPSATVKFWYILTSKPSFLSISEITDCIPDIIFEVIFLALGNGFEFDLSENYGEPLVAGEYKVKSDIYDLDGDIVINKDDTIIFNESTDNIMGYDIFKYKDVYLTTEDLYA